MSIIASPAVLLRRVDYGDFDLILTLFTRTTGKISVIAKHAKKSKKRFAGVLELFSVVKITCQASRRAGLPVLQEALLEEPFAAIRQRSAWGRKYLRDRVGVPSARVEL